SRRGVHAQRIAVPRRRAQRFRALQRVPQGGAGSGAPALRGVPAARGHYCAAARGDNRWPGVSGRTGTGGVTMNLSTEYLGLTLPHPLVAGAGPLADDLDGVRRLEDAGAAAIVLRSLFEEQITREQMSDYINLDSHGESFAEAASFFPSPHAFALGPFQYLEHLRRAKDAVGIPVVASLNGATPGGWLEYARLMAQAGADALELNLYRIATDPDTTSADIERQAIETVREGKKAVTIPVAVKLSSFYTAIANLARDLDRADADALVLFNRFYQP